MYIARMNKKGNIKVGSGIWTWNKLAGAGYIAGCKGTCGEHCQGCYNPNDPASSSCYVFKSYVRYNWEESTIVKGHIRNTKIMRENKPKAFADIATQIDKAHNKPHAIRIHSSGEFEDANELIGWIILARAYDSIPFYVYTKAYSIVDEVLSKYILPENLFINISIWHDIGTECFNKWKHLPNVRAFVYMDGYEYDFKPDCMCPAYKKTENGKTKLVHDLPCEKCGICFNTKAQICGCFDH